MEVHTFASCVRVCARGDGRRMGSIRAKWNVCASNNALTNAYHEFNIQFECMRVRLSFPLLRFISASESKAFSRMAHSEKQTQSQVEI